MDLEMWEMSAYVRKTVANYNKLDAVWVLPPGDGQHGGSEHGTHGGPRVRKETLSISRISVLPVGSANVIWGAICVISSFITW